jgi:hypothetical protein
VSAIRRASDIASRRTINQVVILWDDPEQLVEARIPLIACNRKTSHRNITIVQLGQQYIIVRIIVGIFVLAIGWRIIILLLGSR